MASLFSGLNNARSGLMASQTALDIAAQNISNASTPGYSRQTLNLTSAGPDIGAYRFTQTQTLVGYGVNYKSVSQSRDSFLDVRYRDALTENSDWQGQSDAQTQIEDIFNEFSSSSSGTLTGLSGQMTSLSKSLLQYQNNPNDTTMPTTIKSAVDTILFTVRNDYKNLADFAAQEKGDLSITIEGDKTGGGINSILGNIADLNKQIAGYEIVGQKANDLRDQRNTLLDTLSSYADIDVTEQSNGMVAVGLKNDSRHMLVSTDNAVTKLQLNSAKDGVYWADGNTDGTTPAANLATINGGTVDAYLQVINGDGSGTGKYGGTGIAYFTNKLNTFAKGFDNMLNTFAAEYQTITPPTTVDTASSALVHIGDLDPANPAADITISDGWQIDADLFKKNYTGSSIGNYAGELINTIKQNGTVKLTDDIRYSGSILDFSDSFTSDIATALNHTQGMADSTSSIVSNIDAQRKSISSVSIDEEAINIIRFQQSYNASARVITAIDEMIDKLINGTGMVGR